MNFNWNLKKEQTWKTILALVLIVAVIAAVLIFLPLIPALVINIFLEAAGVATTVPYNFSTWCAGLLIYSFLKSEIEFKF